MLSSIQATKTKNENELLQLSRKIETGFPSPAGDHLEKALRLEDLIVRRPTSTFYVRVEGNAMKQSGICDADILVVDRSLRPGSGSILVITLEEEVIIRRYVARGHQHFLLADDPQLAPIPLFEETNWMIWGVVTHVIHRFMEEQRG